MAKTEKHIFIDGIQDLIKPHVRKVIEERFQEIPEGMQFEDEVEMLHTFLLERIYDLCQTDGQLSMYMIPIMAYLRKIDKERQKAFGKKEQR